MTNKLILAVCLLLSSLTINANVVGGDISMLPEYESHNAKYRDDSGKAIADLLPWLKEQGWNAIRVRLFVDPTKAPSDEIDQGVRQDLEYVKALGARIKASGLKLMLDFHYSDSWADPAKQFTPDAWKSLSDTQLYDTIYTYTKACLQEMVAAGATPDYIQTGNEISYGMLWGPRGTSNSNLKKFYPGDTSTHPRFLTLLSKSAQACREVCPEAKIVIHTELVRNISMMNSYYNAISTADYDIIGLSYYPYYHYGLHQLVSAITNIESRFPDKEVMIVEAGFYHEWQPESGISFDYSTNADQFGNTYAISNEGQRAFTAALVQKLLEHPIVTGLFWWFPEANEYGINWQNAVTPSGWYNAGLWKNETGRVLPALFELAAFAPTSGITGDVNGDKLVDVEDVNAIINIILKIKSASDYPGNADMDDSGIIDVEDVNAVINIILKQ